MIEIRRIFKLLFKNKKKIGIVKDYEKYEDYINHQKEKTCDPERRKKWLGEEWVTKLDYFEKTFMEVKECSPDLKGKAIALGARTGQEVQAMINNGLDAIGIDIVPCEPLVVAGDIHNIPFKDSEFDFAFTNIMDHSIDPFKFMQEIKRVVKKGGLILFHISIGETDEYGVNELLSSAPVVNFYKNSKIIWDEKMEKWGGLNHRILIKLEK